MKPVNLILQTGRTRTPVGKVVQYGGRWIFHSWQKAQWIRHEGRKHLLGLNQPVVRWLHSRHIDDVYFYFDAEGVTFHTTVSALLERGEAHVEGGHAGNFNLPRREWDTLARKLQVPFVPDRDTLVIRAEDYPPPVATPTPSPTPTQLSLL